MVVSDVDKDKGLIEIKVICICKIAGKEKEMAYFQTPKFINFDRILRHMKETKEKLNCNGHFDLNREEPTFFFNGQRVNSLDFKGHTISSTTTEHWNFSKKIVID